MLLFSAVHENQLGENDKTEKAKLNVNVKPRLTQDQFESMVTRLTRLNTTTAYKMVLWSYPRTQYESDFKNQAILKTPQSFSHRYDVIGRQYPAYFRHVTEQEMGEITRRLTQPTVAHAQRASVNIERRRVIEAHKRHMRERDVKSAQSDVMTARDPLQLREPETREPTSARYLPRDVTCERRRERARRAPFMEWRDHDFDAILTERKERENIRKTLLPKVV